MGIDAFRLDGCKALVTGAATGIGAAISVALAEAGADVACHGNTRAPDATCAKIEKLGRRALPLRGDLASRETPAALVDAAATAFGRIDLLVNNAGMIRRAPALDFLSDDWDQVVEVNLSSVFRMCQQAGRRMLAQGRGKIVNVASLLSFQGGITVPAYAASKGGVAQLTKALSNEWASRGVNVNAIAPGYVKTENTSALQNDANRNRQILERIPAGRWAEPEDLGGAAVFLCARASDYVHGHVLVVDGGWLGAMTAPLRPADACRFDLVSLGEVMLRLDPGEGRIHTTREFRAWEGGGEYNVARGLRRCFGMRTAIVTALADNPVGRLIEDLMLQGGVDLSHLRWVKYDGVGRDVRNGLNFTERGFGPRGGVGCSDRGLSAASQMKPGDVDWGALFGGAGQGARWLHTGGIFCALSAGTPAVAAEAMKQARAHGTRVSYDLNYRDSLWRSIGGKARAREVNRALMPLVDVVFGNEEDFSAALGFELAGVDERFKDLPAASFRGMIADVTAAFPNITTVATTLRTARSASVNGWGAICSHRGQFHEVAQRDVEILDRVGGGDSFASGLVYGLLAGKDPQWALECGVAHGALAMSTPGDTTMATLPEVLAAMKGPSARIDR